MDSDQFIGLLQHPDQLDEKSGILLGQLLREYPYCQPLHLLYLLSLLRNNDVRFNHQLRLAATYAPDRKLLYERVTSLLDKESGSLAGSTGNLTDRGAGTPGQEDSKPEVVKQVEKSWPLPETDLIHFGFPPGRPEDYPDPVPPVDQSPGDDLIDKFIRNSDRKIIRSDEMKASDLDLSVDSLKEDDEMLTETLARIYIQQGYFEKALLAYEKLSLKFPDKSAIFAGQIEKLKELIKNQ